MQVVVALKLYVYVMTTFLKKETVNPVAQFSRENLVDIFATNAGFGRVAVLNFRKCFFSPNLFISIFNLALCKSDSLKNTMTE